MCARFLNEQLITRPRFAPGGEKRQVADTLSPDSGPQHLPEACPEVANRPPDSIKATALKRETTELERCRNDLIARYNRLHTDIMDRRSKLDALSEGLERIQANLGATPDSPPDPGEDAAALGQYRQAVEGARIELLKIEKDLTPAPANEGTSSLVPEIASLTLGQLTRIGFGLTWPLVGAVVLGTFGVTAVLVALFAL